MEFQLERRFSLPVASFPIINLSQFRMEDCKVLWDPSGWKVLVVTVTRHRLALGHLQSHSAWSFVGHNLLGDLWEVIKVPAAYGGTCFSASSFNTYLRRRFRVLLPSLGFREVENRG